MNVVHEIINYIANQPSSTWTTFGSYLGGSTLVASLVQILKHKLNFADAKKLLVFVTGFFSFLVAFANFLMTSSASNALPQLGHVTGLVLAGAVVIHRFAVSPAYYKIAAQLKKLSGFLDEVQTLQAQKTAAKPAAATVAQAEAPDEANLAQFQV